LSCSHLNCDIEIYEDGKCIFHCNKESWINEDYVIDDSIDKWDSYRISYFWQKFHTLTEYKLNQFIFPYFDNSAYNDSDLEIIESIIFSDCTFLDDVNIYDFVSKTLEFKNCFFNSQYFTIENNMDDFIFQNLNINNQNNIFIEIKNSTINTCEIMNLNNKKCSLTVNNCRVYNFKFLNSYIKEFFFYNINLDEDSTLLLENITVNKYILEKLSQKSNYLQFNNIKILDNLKFNKIEFNNTYFNNFNIENIKHKVEIEKTSFLGAKFNSFEWGDISIIKASRDTFRQLKYVLDEQKNYIQANNFFVMEMRKYKEELKNKSNIYWEDKLIFFLNEKISDFGRSWLLSILWFIFSSLFIIIGIKFWQNPTLENDYCIYMIYLICSMSIPYFIYKKKFLSIIVILFSFYMFHSCSHSYNPFNEFANFINLKIHENYESYSFVWFIHKLLTSFIIYHFIIALRRQTKR
jgi:hypothetical protein